MKIKFLTKPPGTDYAKGQVAEFNSADWVHMSYAQKYLREGLAEEVIEESSVEKSAAEVIAATDDIPPVGTLLSPPAPTAGRGRGRGK